MSPAAPTAALSPPKSILALCTRRLGDVLLTTPLLRSLKRAWPGARLDVLTLKWSAPALAGNPDVDRVLEIDEGAGVADTLRTVGPFRGYDLALSTLHSDRPHFIALWAGRSRVNMLHPTGAEGDWWKRALSTRHARGGGGVHAVVQYLRLADALGIERHYDLVPPRPAQAPEALRGLPREYAVLHPAPLHAYKRWTVPGWRALATWLAGQGLPVVLTGGALDAERAYVNAVADGLAGVTNLAGTLAFAELTPLLGAAAVFVGADTSVTHLAAAAGVPTVALFGPTATATWGPWPKGLSGDVVSPWRMTGPLQNRGNVWIVQGFEHCVPCHQEGCERHRDSRADCLSGLPPARVAAAAAEALRGRRARQV
jgi:heptosyltransferase III